MPELAVAAPLAEQTWIGQTLRIGDVELEVTTPPCPRCVMVTRELADLGEDRQVLRTIVRHADQHVGVYADVVHPGKLETGNPGHTRLTASPPPVQPRGRVTIPWAGTTG